MDHQILPSRIRSLFVILCLLIGCFSASQAQVYVEIGIPEFLGRRTIPPSGFFNTHGWFTHVGYEYKTYSFHTKIYSGASSTTSTRKAGGFGFSKTLAFETRPKLNAKFGLGMMYLERRLVTNKKLIDYTLQSFFIEASMSYDLNKVAYLVSSFSFGYGKLTFIQQSKTPDYVADAPYKISLGVGYRFIDLTKNNDR